MNFKNAAFSSATAILLATSLSACGGDGGGSATADAGTTIATNEQAAQQFVFLSTGQYVVNVGPNDYLDPNTGHILIPVGRLQFIDTSTGGLVFEETTSLSHDLQKIAAAKQSLLVESSSKKLQATYGLSEDRSLEVARLAVQIASTPKRSMTDADYNSVAQALTGSSMNQFRNALRASQEGNTAGLNQLINKAAEINGVGPEHMNEIMKSVFQ